MFTQILVLCTGNICRSPLGEVLLQRALSPERGGRVLSAGTGAMVGWPADPLSVAVASQHGLDLQKHRAQQASPSLVAGSDLILVMDQSHRQWMLQRFPHLAGRVHRITRFVDDADVPDPYGQSLAAFERSFNQIEAGVQAWVQRVLAAP